MILETISSYREIDQGGLGLHLRLVVRIGEFGVQNQLELVVILHLAMECGLSKVEADYARFLCVDFQFINTICYFNFDKLNYKIIEYEVLKKIKL